MKIFVNLIKTLISLSSIVNGNSEHFISGKIVDEKNNPLSDWVNLTGYLGSYFCTLNSSFHLFINF